MLNWDTYQATVGTAEKSGNPALVDLAADRALRAMLAGRQPARVAVRGLTRDIARDNPTIPFDDRYHSGQLPGPEGAVIAAEVESEYWDGLAGQIQRKVRTDARETVLAVARLLAGGYNGAECATTLGISEMSVSRARCNLAKLLA